jgi:surfactin synthase thioesterase subunit
VDWLLTALESELRDGPYALFGHSMGALLAFQLTHEAVARGLPGPSRLFLSSALPPEWTPRGTLHRLRDSDLVAALAELDNASAAVLAVPEVRDLLLPVVHADLRLAETWAFRPAGALPVPVTVLGGRQDPLVPAAALEGWRRYFTGEVTSRRYPGGHFYLRTQLEAVLSDLAGDLRRAVPVGGGRCRGAVG